MGGHGRPPKDPETRAGRHIPTRGEWQTLPPLDAPILPLLPNRGKGNGRWSALTRDAWEGWRVDWVTGAYGPAEISLAVQAIHLYEQAVRKNQPSMWGEVRQWMDRLGLTLRGKRDLRFRLAESDAVREQPKAGKVLRLVNDAVATK